MLGRLKAELPLKKTVSGFVVPRNNLPHRYSIFGASEFVKVTEDGTLPVRMVNPSACPVKIFRKTRLDNFESVEDRIETFQLGELEAAEEFTYSFIRLGRNVHKSIILNSLIYPTAFSVKLTE